MSDRKDSGGIRNTPSDPRIALTLTCIEAEMDLLWICNGSIRELKDAGKYFSEKRPRRHRRAFEEAGSTLAH